MEKMWQVVGQSVQKLKCDEEIFTYNSELMEDAASLEEAVEVADLVRVLGGNGAIRIDRGGGRLCVATASSSLPSVLKDPPC